MINLRRVDVPKHPLELTRIEDYRPFGFDGFEPIYNWVLQVLKKEDFRSFAKTYKTERDFITIISERRNSVINPCNIIKVEVGYLHLQDREMVVTASVSYCLYRKTLMATVLHAEGENNKPALDYGLVFDEINNGLYLNISEC